MTPRIYFLLLYISSTWPARNQWLGFRCCRYLPLLKIMVLSKHCFYTPRRRVCLKMPLCLHFFYHLSPDFRGALLLLYLKILDFLSLSITFVHTTWQRLSHDWSPDPNNSAFTPNWRDLAQEHCWSSSGWFGLSGLRAWFLVSFRKLYSGRYWGWSCPIPPGWWRNLHP